MSLFDKQGSSFKSNMISASSKISGKRTALAQNGPRSTPPAAAPGSTDPSPSKSSQQANGGTAPKRKRPDANAIVFSQPADTGKGRETMTQIAYATGYLKTKDTPQTLADILGYLSLHNAPAETQHVIRIILQQHDKVIYDPKGFEGRGSYAWRPPHDIRTGDQLLRHLQAQPTAQGLPVKDLLEGWPKAGDEIRRLEDSKKLLVVRNKKDDHARMVWPDDPSLAQEVDVEFRDLWHKIRLPEPEVLQDELRKADIVPTNKAAVAKAKVQMQEKKTKKPRRSGKITNTHMAHILRDYSRK